MPQISRQPVMQYSWTWCFLSACWDAQAAMLFMLKNEIRSDPQKSSTWHIGRSNGLQRSHVAHLLMPRWRFNKSHSITVFGFVASEISTLLGDGGRRDHVHRIQALYDWWDYVVSCCYVLRCLFHNIFISRKDPRWTTTAEFSTITRRIVLVTAVDYTQRITRRN